MSHAVLAIGNVLMRDDAFGPRLLSLLERDYELPDELELVDVGTCGLDLVGYLADRETVIFLDAVVDGSAPGTLHRIPYEVLASARVSAPRLAPHEPAIGDALAMAAMMERGPRDATLIGVTPTSTEVGVGLSDAVTAALPRALDDLVSVLRGLGLRIRSRPPRPGWGW